MNILLTYATNSGGTFLVGELIAGVLRSKHNVEMKPVRELDWHALHNYEAIIIGSNTWDYQGKQGQPHEDFRPWLDDAKNVQYPGKKFAIYCLGDSSFTYFTGSAHHLEEMVSTMQGILAIPTLRIDGFFYDEIKNRSYTSSWATRLLESLG